MKIPAVSIILPAYNGAQWIAKAIQSVLAQSFSDFELLIINDGSTDDTEAIAIRFARQDSRIRYITNERNLGIQRTRNISLEQSCSDYIAEIDQDDEWVDRDKIKKQLDFLKTYPDHVLVGTGAIMVDSRGKEIARYLMLKTDQEIRKKLLQKNCFIHSSVMYRKSAVEAVGGYRIEKMSEDHDLWLRLGRRGKFANLPDYAVKYYLNMKGYNSQDKFIRLKQNLLLIKEHKEFYPNYVLATIIGWLKIIFMPIFYLMPIKIKGMLLLLHKKI